MTKTELAYLAGLFDGEGSIFITKKVKGLSVPRHCLIVDLAMCNEYIPNLLKFNFGGSVHVRIAKDENHRMSWQWRATTREALHFIEIILPYLRLKRNEAELGIAFQKSLHPMNGKGSKKEVSEQELAVREAQRLLLHSLKDKTVI